MQMRLQIIQTFVLDIPDPEKQKTLVPNSRFIISDWFYLIVFLVFMFFIL